MRILIFAMTICLAAGERKPIAPLGVSTIGPYTPAILTGEYLYVSGHIGRTPSGVLAGGVEEQTRVVLNQIKTLVEAAGLTMDHVVYTHLFLTDIRNYEAVNKIYASYFPNDKPARVTVGVARLPYAASVEINAVAVRNLAAKKSVTRRGTNAAANVPISEGISTSDRFFLSGTLGRDRDTGAVPKTEMDQIRMSFRRAKDTLQLAGLTESSLASFTVYHTSAITREAIKREWAKEFGSRIKGAVSIIEVNELALGTHVGVTGIAALNRTQASFHGPCASIGETLYCAAAESAMGPADQQTRDTLSLITSNVTRSGFHLSDASATQAYLDNIDDFDKLNAGYSGALSEPRPTRATIQPAPSGGRRLVQISMIVSRSGATAPADVSAPVRRPRHMSPK